MDFKREQIKDYYLLDTEVENVFINEYMTSAPGDYVKVYLFALMYAGLEQEMSNETVAKQLGLTEEDVLKAWSYWESKGVVRKNRANPNDKFNYQVEFVNLKERLYGKSQKKKVPEVEETTKHIMADNDVQSMYNSIERIIGKVISGAEMMEILSWVNDFHASPEIIVYAYSYCKAKNKQNIRYVAAVVKNWVSQGLADTAAVEAYLADTDQKHYLYKRVCKALGFARNATEKEEKIMNSWFDDMGYTLEKVLEACSKTSGISNPNINYVNTILVNWHKEKTGTGPDGKPVPVSMETVNRYYDHLRKTAEEDADSRKQEAYETVPRLKELEEQMNSCRMEASKAIISDRIDKKEQVKKLQEKHDSLNRERAVLLTENNFEINHLDVHYQCDVCKDTGVDDDGQRCVCFQKILKEAELWQTNSK